MPVSILVLLSIMPLHARAGDMDDRIAEARKALTEGDVKAAEKALKEAEKVAPLSKEIVTTTHLAQLFYYRGLAYHVRADNKGRDMDGWRQTLVIDNDFAWDLELEPAEELQSLFEALRREVRGRGKNDTGIPEDDTGDGPGDDSGLDGSLDDGEKTRCGCTSTDPAPVAGLGLLLAGLLLVRRRR